MSAKRSIRRFLEFRKQYPDSYAIWHSRIATHGVKNESNCHPFRVGGDRLTYLAHNGVLSVSQFKDDPRSDTRVFAEEVFPAMGGVTALDNPTIFDMLCDWARGSKVVVLTIDPRAEKNIYIINEKSGSWDDNDIWWSNTRHRPLPKYEWGGSNYRNSYTPSLTKVISYPNKDTGFWEVPSSHVSMYRGFQVGDIWDQELYCFRTPLPGTPLPPEKVPALSLVVRAVEALNGEVIEEDDDLSSIILCMHCREETDLQESPDYCMVCAMCFECGTMYLDCMCYTPHRAYKYKGEFGF